MAAILTPTHLTLLDQPTLKHPPSTTDPSCPLPLLPSCLFWSAESNSVFLASTSSGIMQYDLTTDSLQDVLPIGDQSDPYVSLLVKDRGNTVIYAKGQRVVVASASSGKVGHTFETHKAPVGSLALSNDSSLLASTSAHAIHVHNLTLASHTVLRGLPSGGGAVTTCAFHPHSRTRLLVGFGTQLLVYDTTRPSGPVKSVPLDKDNKNPGSIVAVTCSPFSKTLVAAACSGGTIGLIDLEKEKALFRVVSMPAPLTCLAFSAEGAALYAGTENGKFLLLDLRALDKPPKSITVSENGDQIIGIAIQKKLKSGEGQTTKPAAKPLVQRDTNKAAPAARRVGATGLSDASKKAAEEKLSIRPKTAAPTSTTPRRATTARTVSNPVPKSGSPVGTKRPNAVSVRSPTAARSEAQRRAFSPPKSPIARGDKNDGEDESNLSVRVENLLALPKATERPGPGNEREDGPPASAVSRAPSAVSRVSARTHGDGAKPRTLTRTESTASHTRAPSTSGVSSGGDSASAALPRARSASLASVIGRARTGRSASGTAIGTASASPAPPAAAQRRRVSGSSAVSRLTRTPSPDFPDLDVDDGGPMTPIPAYKSKGKGKERAALGLSTPEVDAWVKAGEGRDQAKAQGGKDGKRVGFAGDDDSDGEAAAWRSNPAHSDLDLDSAEDSAEEPPAPALRAHPELAMQVSPRRPGLAGSRTGAGGWAPVPSPLRPAGPGSPHAARAAQDMLQALLRDALHDFRQETKGELVGLHLDLIRMGASWRREMRDAMGEFADEMRELREENRRLREENERLRRGF